MRYLTFLNSISRKRGISFHSKSTVLSTGRDSAKKKREKKFFANKENIFIFNLRNINFEIIYIQTSALYCFK